MRNRIKHNDDFNERTNTLLYKNISLTFLLTIAALLPHLGLGCSTMGHWGPQALSLQTDSHAGILSPNWLQLQLELPKPSVAPGYIIVLHPPASAVSPLIHTGTSLDWRLDRGSIYNNTKWSPNYVLNTHIVA